MGIQASAAYASGHCGVMLGDSRAAMPASVPGEPSLSDVQQRTLPCPIPLLVLCKSATWIGVWDALRATSLTSVDRQQTERMLHRAAAAGHDDCTVYTAAVNDAHTVSLLSADRPNRSM